MRQCVRLVWTSIVVVSTVGFVWTYVTALVIFAGIKYGVMPQLRGVAPCV